MTRDVLLHVGMHKTGTTSIQKFFAANRARLREHQILYPELFGGDSHPDLALSLRSQRAEMIERMKSAGYPAPPAATTTQWPDRDSAYGRLAEEAEQSDAATVVVSTECFMEWLDPADVRDALNQFLPGRVTVLIYVRNQADWMRSVYRQVVRDREIRFAGEPEELPQWEQLDYLSTLREWAAAFGRDAVRVRSYDTVTRTGVGVVRDVLTLLHGPADPRFWYPMRSADTNAALTAAQTAELRELNRAGVPDAEFEAVVQAMIAGSWQPASRRSHTEELHIRMADFTALNAEIESRYLDPGHRIGPPGGAAWKGNSS